MIFELVQQWASSTPNRIALVENDKKITYSELLQMICQKKLLIEAHGIKENGLIAVSLPNSIELVVTLLCILKHNCAYIPIDPSWPQNRVSKILIDSDAACLIQTDGILPKIAIRKNYHTQLFPENYLQSVSNNLIHSKKLAYVIFTSGSTGTPKGVQISEQALLAYLYCCWRDYFNNRDGLISALHSSAAFDMAVCTTIYPIRNSNAFK